MGTSNTEAYPSDLQHQQTGPERVRKAVIEAATRLFAERGIHAVSVREIAREVGVSHTLLHLYFGSKDEIVREVLQSRNGRYADVMAAAAETPVAVGDTFKAIANDREWLRAFAAGMLEGLVPGKIDTYPKTHAAFVNRFENVPLPEGGVDRRVLGAAIMAMVIGWSVGQDFLRAGAGLGEMTDEEFIDGLGDLLERMVRDYA